MKKCISFILLLLILITPSYVKAVELINTHSTAVVIYDIDDDKILYDINGDQVKYVASLTKIVTTITAIDYIESHDNINFSDKVTITQKMLSGIQWDASRAGLKAGDVVTYEDLLYATILPSGADAAQAIAYGLRGDLKTFVGDMNALAKKLEMNNSNFVNTHGLDIDNHLSTANDMMKVLKYAFSNETFKKVYQAKTYTLTNGLEVGATIDIYNKKYNLDVTRILGSKTGFTDNAFRCLSTYFESNGHRFLTVTLGAGDKTTKTAYYHVEDGLNIIDFMDKNFQEQLLHKMNTDIAVVKINYANIDTYEIKESKNVTKYLPNDYDPSLATYKYDGIREFDATDIPKGKLGTIYYYYDNVLLDSEDVILDVEVKFDVMKYIEAHKETVIKYILILAGLFIGISIFIAIVLKLLVRKK